MKKIDTEQFYKDKRANVKSGQAFNFRSSDGSLITLTVDQSKKVISRQDALKIAQEAMALEVPNPGKPSDRKEHDGSLFWSWAGPRN